jgi:hypothetical protein
MATKSGNKGRYICKVGHFDIYAKDTMKKSTERGGKLKVSATDYQIYHSKNLKEKGFKTKDLAVTKATEMMNKHIVKA